MLLGVLLAFLPAETPADAAWCGQTRVTAYVRGEGSDRTFDGTSIWTREPIAAASWDVRMGSVAEVPGLGRFRVADRGMLGNGVPLPWLDIAVWSYPEALAVASTRHVCFRRPSP
jgi:hypothetical protein